MLDCDDIPVSPFDQALALDQIEAAYTSFLQRKPSTASALETQGWRGEVQNKESLEFAAKTFERFSTAHLAHDGEAKPSKCPVRGPASQKRRLTQLCLALIQKSLR